MRPGSISVWVFASLCLCRSLPAQATAGVDRPASSPAAADARRLSVARAIMSAARYCALITQDTEGRASARTMDPSVPDSAMVVHFATTPSSRKVAQLARDDRVTLYYFDAKLLRYVTLYGRAKMVRDPAQKRRAWKADWNPFYPKKEADAVVYRVTPERLEIVSPPDDVLGDSVTWKPVTVPLQPRTAPR